VTAIETGWFHAAQLVLVGPPPRPIGERFLLHLFQGSLLQYLAVATLVYAARHHALAKERAVMAVRAGAAATRARLELLARKLHPHFLYNSLNAAAELVHTAPVVARRVLDDLRALLAATLRAARSEVTLAEELELLGKYLEIQRTRFGARLTVTVEAARAAQGMTVPHLLLQPLVENAIRHGVARRGGGRIAVAARLAGERLELSVRDDGPGFPGTAAREGLGLRNTRERLAAIGASPPELRGGPDGAEVVIRLPARPLRPEPEAGAATEVPPPPRLLPAAAVVLAACTLAAVASFGPRFLREGPPEMWLRWTAGTTALLALVALLVAGLAWEWPIERGRATRRIALHLIFLGATVALLPLARAVIESRPGPIRLTPRLISAMPGDVALYLVAAGLSHAARALARARNLAREAARLDAEAASAELAARHLALDPAWLDAELAAIGRDAAAAPQLADDRIAALAERLREKLTEDEP